MKMNFKFPNKSLFFKYPFRPFSVFSHVKQRPSDPILGLLEEFKLDKDSRKVNLSAGTYKDDNGKPYILNAVKEAQRRVVQKGIDHEYLPIDGLRSFIDKSLNLAYSQHNNDLTEGKIAGIQSLSGTGALKIGFEFIKDFYPYNKTILIPNPSWPNHKNVVTRSGLNYQEYRYYDYKNKVLDLEGLLTDLDKAQSGSVVLLHVCAHNPTGMDPSQTQWEEILRVIKQKNHFPFFDMAYQGFASGDPDKDAFALRMFCDNGIKVALAQSFAKNFGLYGQRIGCFSVITDSKLQCDSVSSQLKFLARAQYSNPPKHGAHLVDIILSDPELTQEWHRELRVMSERISSIRQELYNNLVNIGSKLDWTHIVNQIGMFAFTGLTTEQTNLLKKFHHVYLTDDGRISISGLNTKNVEYVAQAFHSVTLHNSSSQANKQNRY